jgi:hypothetical protein
MKVVELEMVAPMNGVFRLSTVLAAAARPKRERPKRERTRASLLAAAAAEMERVGYESLTVDDIVDRRRPSKPSCAPTATT